MLSVVIPFIEISQPLLRTLSILSTSDKVDEILLIQNSLIDSINLNDIPKTTIIKAPVLFNRSYARNHGAHFAQKSYILFLDQDILLANDFIDNVDEKQLADYDIILPKIIPFSPIETKEFKKYFNKYKKVSRGSFCIFSRTDLAIPNFDSACFIVRKDFFLKTPMFNSKFIRFEDRHWARHAVHRSGHFYCDSKLICHKDISDKNKLKYYLDQLIDHIFHFISNQYFYQHSSKFPTLKRNWNYGIVKILIRFIDKNSIEKAEGHIQIYHKNQNHFFKLSPRHSITTTDDRHKIVNIENYEYCLLNRDESKALNIIKRTGLLNDGLPTLQLLKKLVNIGLITQLEFMEHRP